MGYYVYKYVNLNNEIIYIGLTEHLSNRIRQHTRKGDCLFNFIGNIYYTECATRELMDLTEKILINKYHPKLNIASNYEGTSLSMDEPNWVLYDKNQEEKGKKNISSALPKHNKNNTPKKDPLKEYFTVKEISKLLNVSKPTVMRVFDSQNIKPDAIESQTYLYLKETVYGCFPELKKISSNNNIKIAENKEQINQNDNIVTVSRKESLLKEIYSLQQKLISLQQELILLDI